MKCKIKGCSNEAHALGFEMCLSCYRAITYVQIFATKEGGMSFLRGMFLKRFGLKLVDSKGPIEKE